jgi:hypothetical protein
MYSVDASRYEIATRIEIPAAGRKYQVKRIFINGKGFNNANPVRVHLYGTGNYGEPAEDLLNRDVVIAVADVKGGVLEIDIEDQYIVLNKPSFFISVQWIADSLNQKFIDRKGVRFQGPGLSGTYELEKPDTYIRSKKNRLGYIWCLSAEGRMYPYNYQLPKVINKPYNLLVSAEVSFF